MDFQRVIPSHDLPETYVSIPDRDFSGFPAWKPSTRLTYDTFQSLIGILVDFQVGLKFRLESLVLLAVSIPDRDFSGFPVIGADWRTVCGICFNP